MVLGSFGLVGGPASDDFLPRQDVYFAIMIALATLLSAFVLVAHRGAARQLLAAALVLDLGVTAAGATFVTVPTSLLASSTPQSSEIARLAAGGRYALYNAYIRSILAEPSYITDSGLTDLNVLRDLPSVQGYGSVVDGTYDHATGTHGLETLQRAALVNGTFDDLDLRVLLTLPIYLGEPIRVHAAIPVAGAAAAPANDSTGVGQDAPNPAPLASGPWPVGQGGTRVFRLPQVRTVLRVIVVVRSASGPPPAKVGVALASGTGLGGPPPTQNVDVVNGQAIYFLSNPARGEMVVVHNPGRTAMVIGAVLAVTSHPDQRMLLDGALQGYLAAGHWRYDGRIGPDIVFIDDDAAGQAWLQSLGSRAPDPSARAPGSVRVLAGSATQPERDLVQAPSPVELVRSETYEPGWSATLVPLGGGQPLSEPVQHLGIVESIEVPAGRWQVSWRYAPSTLEEGAWTSLAGVVLVLGFCLVALARILRRSRHSGRRARHRRGVAAT